MVDRKTMICHSKSMERLIIGIDPDIDKNGVCFLDPKEKKVNATTASFSSLMAFFANQAKCKEIETIVVVEASWMHNKTNWHLSARDSRSIIAAKGYSVGQNHQTGKLICEMARAYGLKVVEHIPLVKCWKGKDRKITDAEIKAFMPIQGRTNQESRDAALLAWTFAGLPIRIKPRNVEK